MAETMREFRLAAHPRGRALEDGDFSLVEVPRPAPGPGEVLLKLRWLAFEPAQKGWMENFGDYVAPMAIGDVMRGIGLGEVIESRNPALPVGTLLTGMTGWREYVVTDGEGYDAVEPALPPTAMLSLLGLTGLTAWVGLFRVGKPVTGDTVLVSGAAGATGSIVGQLARIAGCRTIGIAGGEAKCRWLTEEAGFDVALDYKAGDLKAQLRAAAPGGVHVAYDNVGGPTLDAMLGVIAHGARVVICGGISRYETGGKPTGPGNYFNLVMRRATMGGFIVFDHAADYPDIRRRLTALALAGSLRWQVDEQTGFENAPATLRRLFEGANFGKQVLRIS
ncbi:NADP-dependent oxidoreductase [Sphingomonas profundi]|uniref:NADP-dependent oxidoreductase n=1 Tax=Alterirhizorhabdus profundi TaxID=2681549 RepID=UPI0012E7BB71|nr:NADP-dependent oxidoreductase [Sphingomonas profundi]